MKFAIILLLAVQFFSLGFGVDQDSEYAFHRYVTKYQKRYSSPEEHHFRHDIFIQNYNTILNHNRKNTTYRLGVNEFTDRSVHEYHKNHYFGKVRGNAHQLQTNDVVYQFDKDDFAYTSIDWVAKGAVTPVKNQGECGSCWSFSTTGAIEGLNFVRSKKLISLSEQQLIDCSSDEGNSGCNGGLMSDAFQYVKDAGGICTENSYPYDADVESCKVCKRVVQINGYKNVVANNDTAMVLALARGPVSVAIQANLQTFQLYKSGVYSDTNCGTDLDHGVLLVGVGQENGQNYWLVKNSWGPSWGLNGYIKIARGRGGNKGLCGILMMGSQPY